MSHYAEVDEWFKGGAGLLKTGWVGTSQMLCPDATLAKSEFYSDFLRPYDLFNQCGAIIKQSGTSYSAITLLRSKRKRPFGDPHVKLLRALLPHLQRALELHQKFVDLRAENSSLEAALNSFAVGVVLLNARGRIVFVNPAAQSVLDAKDGLRCENGKLCAALSPESARLQELIARAANGAGNSSRRGGALLISRLSLRPLSLVVAPLTHQQRESEPGASALVFISAPERATKLPSEMLQDCYGLTAAESRLTLILVEGYSLVEAAELAGVTHNTVRSQLKSIFAKTQVQRQGELIRLLVSSSGFAGWKD